VPGFEPGTEHGAVEKLLEKTRKLDLVRPGLTQLDAPSLSHADALLLDTRAVPVLSRHGDELVRALETSVESGAGLVVTGQGAAALPDSERISRLLGRQTGVQSARHVEGDGAALRLLDQRHPITECVTDLYFSHLSVTAAGATDVLPLGRLARQPPGPANPVQPSAAGTASPSVLWTRTQGRGRVVVLALEPAAGSSPGAPDREKEALSFLVARALEWVCREHPATRIPRNMPLAVERLRPQDAGCLPGLPPTKGFYRGRQMAPVMGYQAADWLMRADREETELPEKTLDSLEIRKGSTVVDLGAGAGYFSLRLARRVGPTGRVLATDVQPEMLHLLRENMAKTGIKNVEPILATESDARLPRDSVDLALLVDVYHEFSKPAEILEQVRRSLKTKPEDGVAGRLVLVEFRGEDPFVPIKPLHRTTVQQIRGEIEPAGFAFVEVKGFLPHQHILVFEREK